ncbi:hypothetical protein [Brucella pseudintermedia]|uniref:hypothetical protein n=1 Tax=Brucella pseudintermedia TaxID=370111 RepID=UPI00124CAF2D|nr:hypothetical protein [Brucella pseudintermedia]KAB2679773.1 hypothetical protein F9K78_19300 [Brucella pseudintermedia]
MTVIISDEAVNIALNTWLGGIPAWRNDATERLRTEMRAALTAALPFLPVQVAVKKLEWGELRYTEDYSFAQDAETSIGRYIATDNGWFLQGQSGWKSEDDIEAAKAAAQADYEARILSALEPTAARELALDVEFATIRAMIYCYEGDSAQAFEAQKALAKIEDAIRALSSPDHADAGKVEGGGCERCGGKGEIVVGKGRHGDTIIEDCPSCNTPQDVINLVIAAREACDTWLLPECEFKLLDKALEAFSERVPYENEPDALPSAPSEGAE